VRGRGRPDAPPIPTGSRRTHASERPCRTRPTRDDRRAARQPRRHPRDLREPDREHLDDARTPRPRRLPNRQLAALAGLDTRTLQRITSRAITSPHERNRALLTSSPHNSPPTNSKPGRSPHHDSRSHRSPATSTTATATDRTTLHRLRTPTDRPPALLLLRHLQNTRLQSSSTRKRKRPDQRDADGARPAATASPKRPHVYGWPHFAGRPFSTPGTITGY
jgi:hypothetical protein